MSSVEALREFIHQRLTAAAQEIFTVFEQTIVQYEGEIDRQHRLFEITWKPQIKLQRTELPQQQHLREKQLFKQKTKDCPEGPEPQHVKEEQEEPELPLFKEEQEEPEPPQVEEHREGEPLKLKVDGDTFRIPSLEEQSHLGEPEVPDTEQFLFHDFEVHRVKTPADSGSTVTEEFEGIVIFDSDGVDKVPVPEKQAASEETHGEIVCKTQKRNQNFKSVTEKKILCGVCGRRFGQHRHLLVHMRSHTCQKSHSCQTCGKSFTRRSHLIQHFRIHTGEKPYSCHTCGKSFSQQGSMLRHMRTHTGPYPCEICGTSFGTHGVLLSHMATHSNLFVPAPRENSQLDGILSHSMEDLLQGV